MQATLLEEQTYLCSTRTMYRILDAAEEVRERRAQARHPAYAKPELVATAPNQIWSWDITKLKGPIPYLSVSNSLSGRHWELDQVPAVGDRTDIVQLGTGHHVSAGEGRVAAYLVVVGQTPGPRNVASILDSARELGIRDAQVADESMHGQESLCLPGRFEPAHLSLALPCGLVGDFGAIVLVSVRAMGDGRHDRSVRSPVAAQLVGD